ncbi:MAG: S41 family peptidase [Flammeovirgaceae bacterium]|nr:S41 family peptidase [Flammeovirgaceae bacterium]
MKKVIQLALGVFLIGVFLALRTPGERYFEIAKSLDIFATLFKEVNAYYVDEVDPKTLIRPGIDEMLESLDPYTDYIPEEELESFRTITTGQYAGIGALIGRIRNKTVITHPYKNYPAYNAGIKVGDEIVAIDGKDVKGKPTQEVSTLLKGQAQTDVEVRVKRPGKKEDLVFKITREKISLDNVTYAGIIDSTIGYIKLEDFTNNASREVTEALFDVKGKGARSLILDLRNNPGGLLHEAVNIVNLFIPKGKGVVSTKGRLTEWNKSYTTLNNPVDTEIPLIVLINENSASASEIVAGALQDYDRAILIGSKTFGKGLVQTTRQLPYNAQLKVTTAKYYIPSGRCIQALDYAHRKADGSAEKFPDSLKREFKTASGRKVYDGAGLDPDITIERKYLGTITQELITHQLFFDFATKYREEHPNLWDFEKFELNQADYDQFVAWVKAQDFKYTTVLEGQSEDLQNTAKEEQYYRDIQSQLTQLKAKIQENKANDFVRFKTEISEILKQQIAFHYSLNEGASKVSLNHDNDIATAKKLLLNEKEFMNLLAPH